VSCAATKIDHLVLRKSALAEKERLRCVFCLRREFMDCASVKLEYMEGVHGLCKCEVGIYGGSSWTVQV